MTQRDKTAGQNTGTSSRAHALSEGMSRLSPGHKYGYIGTGDRDTPGPDGRVVPIPMGHGLNANITPWPNYDDHKRDWWQVDVCGVDVQFRLSWSKAEGRFADSRDWRALRYYSLAASVAVEAECRRRIGDDRHLKAFRARFGAILASMTADQQAKFERDMLGGAA